MPFERRSDGPAGDEKEEPAADDIVVVLIFLDLIVFWRLVDGFGVIKSSSDDIVCKSKKNI